MNTKPKIVVTCDFTEISENAFLHALLIAKKLNAQIDIIHIVEKEKEIEKSIENLKNFANKFPSEGITLNYIAKVGSIFDEIKNYAFEVNALFVIMGTHGIKGMQKLLGSRAIKVIANSFVPFIVVQDKPNTEEYFTKIILPLDDSIETKEKLKLCKSFKKYFSSKFYIITKEYSRSESQMTAKANLLFAKRHLNNIKADFEVIILDKNVKLAKSLVEKAEELQANGILIMTTKNPQFTDYIFGTVEEEIIANTKKIPVICVNPRIDLKTWSSFY